ncbi:MAG: hypothetical protein ACMG6E_03540 [Candidatus Roizmanbacteria bacterium]
MSPGKNNDADDLDDGDDQDPQEMACSNSCILVGTTARRPGRRRSRTSWRTRSRCRDSFETASVITLTTPLPYNIEKACD